MATPVDFKEKNAVLLGGDPGVLDLPIHRGFTQFGEKPTDMCPIIISCWQFTREELEAVINNDGKFHIICYGNSHPPLAVSGNLTFTEVNLPPNTGEN